MVQLIYGDADSATYPIRTITLNPPHPSARWTPFRTLPWKAKVTPFYSRPFGFAKYVTWSEDPTIHGRNDRVFNVEVEDRPGLEWGAWIELEDEGEEITPAFLPFVADNFRNLPELLPKEIKERIGRM